MKSLLWLIPVAAFGVLLSFAPPVAHASGSGPGVAVGSPVLVGGKVQVPVYAVGVVGDAYQGFNVHLRWDPAVFSFSSASAAGGVFDPSVGSGTCPAANTGAFDADGGGVVFGCAGYSATNASGKLLATFTLTPAASGCSKIHLYTFGPPDGGDSSSGTFTVNAADFSAQANAFYDGTADTMGHACMPPAAALVPSTPGAQGQLAAATGHCAYDINRNGVINILDLSVAAGAYNHKWGDNPFPIWADVNVDGRINILDLSSIAGDYFRTVSNCTGCHPLRLDDGPTNYFTGWVRSPGAVVGGVYASILNYSPWTSTSTVYDNRVVAWTMLNASQTQLFAQVGWWAYPWGDQHTFYEYTDTSGGSFIKHDITPEGIGTSSYYTVLYDPNQNIFTFQVQGVTIATAPSTFVPNEAQIFGETHTLASQVPGGAFNPEVFADSQIYVTGAWQAFSGVDASTNPYGQISDVSNTQRKIWDTQCGF